MTAFSNYLEEKVVDWSLRATAMGSAPASVYVALHTGDPGETGASNEVSGGSYARVQVTAGFSAHGAAGPTSNSAEILFPTATAAWGTVTHWSIQDASSSGNCLYKGALTNSRNVQSGDAFRFAAGTLQITLN